VGRKNPEKIPFCPIPLSHKYSSRSHPMKIIILLSQSHPIPVGRDGICPIPSYPIPFTSLVGTKFVKSFPAEFGDPSPYEVDPVRRRSLSSLSLRLYLTLSEERRPPRLRNLRIVFPPKTASYE